MLENLKLRRGYDGFLFLAESTRNPPKLKSHHHRELELNLVVRGSVTYVVSGVRYMFPQGSLLWFFPAQEHQLVDRSVDAQYYVAVFKPGMIARSCRGDSYARLLRKRLDGFGVLHNVLDPSAFDLARRTMDSVMQGSLDPDLLNREAGFGVGSDFRFKHDNPSALNAGLHYLIHLCWRYQCKGQAACTQVALHPAVCRALAVLSQDGFDGGLQSLARQCHVSPSHLSRLFNRQVGVPLNRYRNAIRLERFWGYRRQSREKKTIAESVYAGGFGSYAQFYKVFTQTYGEGPREFLPTGSRASMS